MRRTSVLLLLLLCVGLLALVLEGGSANSVVVGNGYEFHASLTSPEVTRILVAANITFTIDTCPFPANEQFPATIITRNVTIVSYSQAAVAEAAAVGVPLDAAAAAAAVVNGAAAAGPPFWINCNHLNGRFQLAKGFTLELNSVVLVNCRTLSTAGFVTKRKGSTLILNNTVENQGSVCLPLPTAQGIANTQPRQPGLLAPAGTATTGSPQQQQVTSLAPSGSNWCAAAATRGTSGSTPPLPPLLLPLLLSNYTNSVTCQQSALLLGNTAWLETPTPINATSNKDVQSPQQPPQQEAFTMLATRSAILCPEPVPVECLRQNGTDACLSAAYQAVNPDANPPCPAFDGFGVHNCLVNPSVSTIMLLADSQMNLTTCPGWLSEDPLVIQRNVTIMSDPRGPRLTLDCNSMTDRVQIAPGVTIKLHHIILSRCSIGHEKPAAIFRFDQGSQLIVNDTVVLQPDNLCLPLQQQSGSALHQPRPAAVPGLQSIKMGQPQAWCARTSGTRTAGVDPVPGPNSDGDSAAAAGGNNVDPTSSFKDNNSYSVLPPLPQVYANRTGLGPVYAATLDQPAARPYYINPTWPNYALCAQQVLLLPDFAYEDRFGWSLPVNLTRSQALQMLAEAERAASNPLSSSNNDTSTAAAQQQQQEQQKLPPQLVTQLGPGYNGTLPVHYINSVWTCQQPSAGCASLPNRTAQKACLLQGYAAINPDVAAAAAAAGGSGGNYGMQVVLPAVLGSIGGALLLASLACCLLAVRRRNKIHKAQQSLAMAKGPYDPAHSTPTQRGGLTGWLFGHTSAASSDPARRLLGIQDFSPAGTSDGTTPSGSGDNRSPEGQSVASSGRALLMSVAPDGISLSMLLGAGSFGRVYSGLWDGTRVAVKIISHSAEDDTRISRELSLSLSFDHPNLVRSLHYARIRINPNSAEASLGAPSSAGTGSLFLPEGAVGVFDLPSTWAVIQKQGLAGPPPMIDTETWIVMDLMDRGNLAAAIRQGAFLDAPGEAIRPAALLRRCADIAAGVTYLHSRNVCHGDLKCENVLLRTEPQDPDGLMAAVADFGLSRALAFGQSHLSTRRYGTVTHMPPELLVAGKLTPAADVYSFGIMMWEMTSRTPPFAGLHHGEVIHKVVTQDLRPGPWPAAARQCLPPAYIQLAEACWARQSTSRPSADIVLQRLLDMLADVEGQMGQHP